METADLIVIGSGQGGIPLACDFAKEGRNVVMFERDVVGGSCVNYGCTPSKAFLASAHSAGRARGSDKLGIHAQVTVDFPAVMQRVRSVRDSFNQGATHRVEEAGVKLIRAEASFTDVRSVTGGDVTVQAPIVVINTGTSSLIPEIPGLAGTPYLTNRNFFDLKELPPRIVVLGAGYIGLELGQGIARLGAKTDIVVRGDRVLNHEMPEVGEVLQQSLEQDGVRFHFNTGIKEVRHADGVFHLTLSDGRVLEAEAFLVAVGRVPNTKALNVSASGIELDDQQFIKIDEQFHTTCEGVYAIGDASHQPAFTHVSWEDYRRLKAILSGQDRSRSDRVLGYSIYTEPQVGRVGITAQQAQQKGMNVRTVKLQMSQISRAIEWGHELGFYEMTIDADTDQILGATLVGYEAAEIVHVFLDLMQAGATWQVLEQAVHIHPTYGEALPSLARLLV